jgi:hypothetical protein
MLHSCSNYFFCLSITYNSLVREPLPKPPTPKPDIVIPIPSRDFYNTRKVIKEIIEPLPSPPPNITIEKWFIY